MDVSRTPKPDCRGGKSIRKKKEKKKKEREVRGFNAMNSFHLPSDSNQKQSVQLR